MPFVHPAPTARSTERLFWTKLSPKPPKPRARLIADALKVFGLYPVFVTPNKEISLLKKHTRRAICVQKGTGGSSLATISWEKLAELQPGP